MSVLCPERAMNEQIRENLRFGFYVEIVLIVLSILVFLVIELIGRCNVLGFTPPP